MIQIGSKTAEKNSAQTKKQTNRQTDRHYENNGHLAVNQLVLLIALFCCLSVRSVKLVSSQDLGARKYSLLYHIISYSRVSKSHVISLLAAVSPLVYRFYFTSYMAMFFFSFLSLLYLLCNLFLYVELLLTMIRACYALLHLA